MVTFQFSDKIKRELKGRWRNFVLNCLLHFYFLLFSAGTKTAAATVVVQSPFLSPAADWVIFAVFIIKPVVLKSCLRSSHAVSGSNTHCCCKHSCCKVFGVIACCFVGLSEGMMFREISILVFARGNSYTY